MGSRHAAVVCDAVGAAAAAAGVVTAAAGGGAPVCASDVRV